MIKKAQQKFAKFVADKIREYVISMIVLDDFLLVFLCLMVKLIRLFGCVVFSSWCSIYIGAINGAGVPVPQAEMRPLSKVHAQWSSVPSATCFIGSRLRSSLRVMTSSS
jgi:hypothetical protein